jgi:nucleoside-diphosphate-sugar epimerase
VKRLVDDGVPVWTYDLPGSTHRLRLVMDDAALAKVQVLSGDITDEAAFESAVAANGITHIVHLAGLQVPFVRADPVQGARVNVVGTTIVLETARRHAAQVRGVVYASSAAVYGPPDAYPPGMLAPDAPFKPASLYGVFKATNEATALIYWQEYGLPSIGLRPYVVYGPGRDQGMTSAPTKAMLAAAVGREYVVRTIDRTIYHYAGDAAGVFIRAARARGDGAPVYNLGGSRARMADVVAAIETAVPGAAGRITCDARAPSTVVDVDDRPLVDALGPIAWVTLADGVRWTIEHFQRAIRAGRLDVERALA